MVTPERLEQEAPKCTCTRFKSRWATWAQPFGDTQHDDECPIRSQGDSPVSIQDEQLQTAYEVREAKYSLFAAATRVGAAQDKHGHGSPEHTAAVEDATRARALLLELLGRAS
jgi:hypothetical protein